MDMKDYEKLVTSLEDVKVYMPLNEREKRTVEKVIEIINLRIN